jgi:glycosyltransferase involved in cell wall biosynthesis
VSSTWVVIPAYDEAEVIATVVKSVREYFRDVLVVDDGSADDTAELALSAGAVVLRHPFNLGQGAALQTGVTYALDCGADLIVTFDADGQHRIDDVPGMIERLRGVQADVVLGSRFLGRAEGLPWLRRIVLKLAVLFTRVTTGLNLTDAHNGLRVFARNAAVRLKIRQDGMAHASEVVEQMARSHMKVVEAPVHVAYTSYSLRKGQRLRQSVRILTDLLVGKMIR